MNAPPPQTYLMPSSSIGRYICRIHNEPSNLKDLPQSQTRTFSPSPTINQIQTPALPIPELALDFTHPLHPLTGLLFSLRAGELCLIEFIFQILLGQELETTAGSWVRWVRRASARAITTCKCCKATRQNI